MSLHRSKLESLKDRQIAQAEAVRDTAEKKDAARAKVIKKRASKN